MNGISFRSHLFPDLMQHTAEIKVVEVIADHYLDAGKEKRKELDLLLEYFTVIPHAISLSIGSAHRPDARYLKKLKDLITYINPPYWSEHISYTESTDREIGHLSPLPFTAEAAGNFISNVLEIQNVIPRPLVLENISYIVNFRQSEFSEAEFINHIIEKSGAALLLDATNLYYNSLNHGYDAVQFLNDLRVPVRQIHLSGGVFYNGWHLDSHSAPTPKEVFDLTAIIHAKFKPEVYIIERDDEASTLNEMLIDLKQLEQIVYA